MTVNQYTSDKNFIDGTIEIIINGVSKFVGTRKTMEPEMFDKEVSKFVIRGDRVICYIEEKE